MLSTQDADWELKVRPELEWIGKLRWGVAGGQIAALLVARWLLDIRLPWTWLGAALTLVAFSNLLLARYSSGRGLRRRGIAGLLFVDICVLTALLSASGGAANPFSVFYIVYVAIAALVLGGALAFALVVLTSASFAALFFIPARWAGPHAAHLASAMHLQGMWMAYVLSAGFVAYFVWKIAGALASRERRIRELERLAAAGERLASLSTMAAGAAHELGTPLSTIAVSATDVADELAARGLNDVAEEARHIRREVARCREILDRLAAGAGAQSGEAVAWLSAKALLERLNSELGADAARRLRVEVLGSEARLRCPPRGLIQSLVNLIRNALEASDGPESPPVELKIAIEPTRSEFLVLDRGVGLAPAVAARAGEPFFTTKAPGRGMGLGLHLVGAFARQMGGQFSIQARPDGGAVATLSIKTDALEHVDHHVH